MTSKINIFRKNRFTKIRSDVRFWYRTVSYRYYITLLYCYVKKICKPPRRSQSHPSCNEAALPRGQSQFSVQRASPEFSISRLRSAPAFQRSRVTNYRSDNQSRPSTSSLNLLSLNYANFLRSFIKSYRSSRQFLKDQIHALHRERTHTYLSTCHVLIYPSKAA